MTIQPLTRWQQFGQQLDRLKPERFSIAYKLALVIALLIVVGMTILGTLIVQHQSRILRHQVQEFGTSVIRQMAEAAKEPLLANDRLVLDTMTTNIASTENILGTALLDPAGQPITSAGIDTLNLAPKLRQSRAAFLQLRTIRLDWTYDSSPDTTYHVLSIIAPVQFKQLTLGYVLVTLDRTPIERSIQITVRSVMTATLLLMIMAILTSIWLGRRLTRPITYLVDASDAISRGHYRHRINERRNDEIGRLIDSFNEMAEGLLQKDQVERALSRYVSDQVAETVLSDLEHIELGGQHIEASVLFADIVGFTSLSEQLEPQEVAQLLNDYFGHIARAANLCRGSVDKFIGDCAMIVFGVPHSDPDHPYNAIQCGLLIQQLIEQLNEQRVVTGKQPVQFRIGVNAGVMLAGNMGSHDRMQYTVVGDAVNLAARLCAHAAPSGVIVSEAFLKLEGMSNQLLAEKLDYIRLRGTANPVQTYVVHGATPELQSQLDKQAEEIIGPWSNAAA